MSDGRNLSPKQKLIAARAMIRERNPYFSVLVQSATYVWVPKGSLNTMGVTKKGVVYVDEADIERLSIEQVAMSVLHEMAGHFLRDHADRRPDGADPKLWNLAGDCEINDDLAAAGWPVDDFPGGLILPKTYNLEDGMTVEQYYQHLRQMQASQKAGGGKGQGQGKGQKGEGGGDMDQQEPQCGHGWCGSGAGRPLPGEPDENPGQGQGDGEQGEGQLPSAPGRTPGEADRIRKSVAQAMQKHEKQYGRGSLPGNWSRWADDMLQPPKVDWRSKLNQLVRDAVAYRPGAVVTTWRRFGRRQAALGFGPGRPMTPAWRNPVPSVAVCVDTSGSMGHEELSIAISETDGILKAVMAEVQFLAIDCNVNAVTQVRNATDLSKHLHGGGGTDFRPAFEHLQKAKNGPRPEVVIFITDGDGPAPHQPPPGMKVVWVLVGGYARKPYLGEYGGEEVGWGTFIKIPAPGEDYQENF